MGVALVDLGISILNNYTRVKESKVFKNLKNFKEF